MNGRDSQGLGPALRLLAAASGTFTNQLTRNMGLLAQAVAALLRDVRPTCPEAFDADDNLRDNWEEIVRVKVDAAAKVAAPTSHTKLATRTIRVYDN